MCAIVALVGCGQQEIDDFWGFGPEEEIEEPAKVEAKPVEEIIEPVPVVEEIEESKDLVDQPELIDLRTPEVFDCAARMTGPITEEELANARVSSPVLEETLDAQECVLERSRRELHEDGERARWEWYEVFSDRIRNQAYVTITNRYSEFRYDARGNLIEQRRSLNPGEPLNFHQLDRYDAQNRLFERRIDGDRLLAGVEDRGRVERWVYHSGGELIEHERINRYGEQVVEYLERTELDELGRPWRSYRKLSGQSEHLWKRWSYEGSQRMPSGMELWERADHKHAQFWYSYDAQGNKIEERRKRFDMGWLDVWRFDAEGREIHHSQDEQEDGTIDFLRETTFDAAGNTLKLLIQYRFDEARRPRGGGITRSEYDAQDRLVLTVLEPYDRAGHSIHRDYERRGEQTIKQTRWIDAAGVVLRQNIEQINARGDWLIQRYDRDGDGHFERVYERVFDERGKLLQRTDDQDGDGRIERIQRWTYNAAGQILRWRDDQDGDGVVDRLEERRYLP